MKSELATVTSKGQLVIPARLRRKYSIRKGTKVAFVEEGNRLLLQPITSDFIEGLRGSLPKESRAMEILLEERRGERYK